MIELSVIRKVFVLKYKMAASAVTADMTATIAAHRNVKSLSFNARNRAKQAR
jgi:hypothetical protein